MQSLLLLNTILFSLGGVTLTPPTQQLTSNVDYYNVQQGFINVTFTTEGGPAGVQNFYNLAFDFPSITKPIFVFKLPYEINDRINDGTAYDHSISMDYTPYTTIFQYQQLHSYTMSYKYFNLVPQYDALVVPNPPITFENPFYYDGVAIMKIPTNHTTADSYVLSLLETSVTFGTYDWYINELDSYSYDNGYTDGHDTGLTIGYNDGYVDGYDEGELDGYAVGYDEGVYFATLGELPDLFTILGSAFTSIASILAIQLFPGFTLGLLLFLPLIFGIAYVLLKLLLGNG